MKAFALDLTAGKVKDAMARADASKRDLWSVPIAKLHVVEGFNVRTKTPEFKEHIETLTSLIKENGFDQSKPLSGYAAKMGGKDVVCITDGHCRFEAVQAAIKDGAAIETIPVVMSPKGTTMEDLTVGLVTRNAGRPLTQYEIGTVCKRLVGYGWDEKTIGQRLGIASKRVGDLLELIGAPKAIRDLVEDGTVSASQAIETLKKHGNDAVEKLTAGVQTARAKGKRKATKKHIDQKPSPRSVVRALIDWAEKNGDKAVDAALDAVVQLARKSAA